MTITVRQRDDASLELRQRQVNKEKGVVSRDTGEAESVGLCDQRATGFRERERL